MRKDKRYEAKGVDPKTGKRKSFYSRISQEDASSQARKSYGVQLGNSFRAYYLGGFIPAIVHRSENWRIQVAWAMKNIWCPVFGEIDLDQITRAMVQGAINSANLRYAPKSVHNAYKILHAMLELAEVDGVIDRNPCIKIRLPAIGPAQEIALSFDQLATLIKHSQPLIKPFVLLAGCCSHRLGEAVGSRLADIDKERVLQVRRQVLQLRGKIEITETLKTPQSHRSIPLPDGLYDEIMACERVPSLWICTDTIGGFVKPKNIRRELMIAQERAGLGHYEGEGKYRKFVPLISPHELRHTFISLMENNLEVPRRVVEQLAGKHSKSKIGSYSHADIADMRKAMERYWDQVSTALTTELTTQIRVS